MADRTVVYRLQVQASQFKAQMAAASASVGTAANKMTAATAESEKWRRGMTTVGDTAGKVGLVAAAGLGVAVKAAVDWESAWTGVTKTVDGTASQMAALEGDLRSLTSVLPASHQEIAAVAEAAGQLGVKRDDVAAFTKTMIDLGETTNLSADEAATAIARFTNIMGTSQSEVDRVGSTIVELGNNFATTEAEIVSMAQRLSAAGAIAGLSESDVLGYAAALTSVGVEAEAGGTALSKVFTAVRDASIDGGPKLDTLASVAGTTADEFARMVQSNPAGAIDSFIQGLGAINDQGQSTSAIFKSLGLTDQRLMRAMLSTAEAGDLLGESLDTASNAWAENTALTKEAEKRYGTTAAQVQIAWNQIKDAAIDAGGAMLPVVAQVASTVANVANAFKGLPGPVKSSLSGLTAVTAILGGGLWFGAKAVNGVTKMRGALTDLGGTTTGVKGKLGGVSSFLGGPWGVSIAGATVAIGLLMNEHGKAAGYVDSLTSALDDQTGALTRQTIATNLQDEGWLEYAQSIGVGADIVVDAALGSAEAMKVLKDAAKADDSFFDLTGDADQFIANVEAQGKAQKEAEKNAKLLAEANGETAKTADKASDATSGLTSATSGLNPAMIQSAEEVKAQAKALEAAKDAAGDTAREFINLGDGVDDAKVSLGEWITQLAQQTDALNNFMDNAKKASKRGLRDGLIEDLQAAGATGALRMKQLANATDEEIERANKAWKRGQDAMQDYVNFKVPPKKVDADVTAALTAIERVRAALANVKDKSVTVRVTQTGAAVTPGFGPQANAAGGFISGPGTATSDSIPSYLSNGEYVIKAAAVSKYGTHMFDSLNAMHFAEGGSVDKKKPKPVRQGGLFVVDRTEELEEAIRRLTAVSESQTDAVNRETAKLDEWSGKMSDVAKATVSGFNTGLFESKTIAGDSNIWDSGARGPQTTGGWLENLTTDIAGLNERAGLQSQLAGMGLSGDVLSALLSQGTNSDLSGLITSGGVGQFANLYAQRASLQGSVGGAAGQMAYGSQYAAQAQQLQVATDAANKTEVAMAGLEGRLAAMQAALERFEKTAPERTGASVGAVIKNTTADAARGRGSRG